MTILSNRPPLAGAADLLVKGADTTSRGLAKLVIDMAASDFLGAPLALKLGDGVEHIVATNVASYAFPHIQPDGSVDRKRRGIHRQAIMSYGFGYADKADVPQAVATAFDKAFGASLFIAAHFGVYDKSSNPTGIAYKSVDGRGVLGNVPLQLAVDLLGDDGKPNARAKSATKGYSTLLQLQGGAVPSDADLLTQISDARVDCDGSQHPIFGKLPTAAEMVARFKAAAVKVGLIPEPKARDRGGANGESVDAGETFSKSLAFISSVLAEQLTPAGEASVAMTEALETQLRNVMEQGAAYFAAMVD